MFFFQEAVARRCSSKYLSQFLRKTPALEPLFNKVVGLRCFPLKCAKFLRTPPVAASTFLYLLKKILKSTKGFKGYRRRKFAWNEYKFNF